MTTSAVGINQAATERYQELLRYLTAHPDLRVESLLTQLMSSEHEMTIAEQLSHIDQLKTWLDSFRSLSATVIAELKQRYDVRFTYHSNAIEGNTLSQSETELILSKGITIGGKTLTEHLEVIGHKEAIDYIESLSRSETALGEWELRQIHSLVLRRIAPIEAGQYRQIDVKAAGTEHTYPPHYLLSGLMVDFVDWLQQASATMHPISYACEAYYRFVSIHPFADGNGRTGRLFMNLLLLRAGFPIVSISTENRKQYIDSLILAGRSQHDITAFINLVCQEARKSLIETLSVIATASESKGKGEPFYQAVLDFLQKEQDT